MNNSTNLNQNSLNEQSKHPASKKPYHAPTIKLYGSITELVQANPGTGGDGGIVAVDCTLT